MQINMYSRRIGGAVAAALLTVAFFAACNDSAEAPTTATSTTSDLRSADRLSEDQAQRLRRARAETRWVGDAHHEAMKVVNAFIADSKRAKRKLPSRGTAAYCALLEQAGIVSMRELARHYSSNSQSDHRQRVRTILANECPNEPERGPAVPSSAPFRSAAWTQTGETEVTGQYERFVPAMEEAVLSSDGSTWNIQNRLNNVLAGAIMENIADADLLALASFAGLIESSAEEWNAFDWSAYDSGECDFMDVCPVAVWPSASGVGGKILAVVGADAIGCLSTVKSWSALKLLLGTAVPAALGGECGVRATLASGGAIITMLK